MIVIFRSIIIFSRSRTPISPIGNESSNLSGDVLHLERRSNMAIEIKNVPKEYYFSIGDIVEVTGNLKSGIGKVEFAYYPISQPDGELAYHFKYGEPFPQIGVRFEDGQGVHYNADDLIAGKIIKTNKVFVTPRKLIEFLKELKVIFETDGGGEEVSVYYCCQDRILKFIEPLFEKLCYLPPDTKDVEFIGEFDSHLYCFESIVKGEEFRNSGIPAFRLQIKIDGYSLPTFGLEITEVYQ